MQITWWEYAELLEHLTSRKDIWQTDGVLWTRSTPPDGEIGFALQFLPPTETGPYRMYSLLPTPLTWSEEETEHYLERLCFYWTSYSTRVEFSSLLASELKLDESTSWLMSIALVRAMIEPKEDPERAAPPARVQHLWSDIPSQIHWRDVQGIIGDAVLPLNHGGCVSLMKHHEMIRCQIDIVNPHPANGPHSFRLTGFVRPSGYSIAKFIQMMNMRSQDLVNTPDPDSAHQEGLIYDGAQPTDGLDDVGSADAPASDGDGSEVDGDETSPSEKGV